MSIEKGDVYFTNDRGTVRVMQVRPGGSFYGQYRSANGAEEYCDWSASGQCHGYRGNGHDITPSELAALRGKEGK